MLYINVKELESQQPVLLHNTAFFHQIRSIRSKNIAFSPLIMFDVCPGCQFC